jgi:hypothetical protein
MRASLMPHRRLRQLAQLVAVQDLVAQRDHHGRRHGQALGSGVGGRGGALRRDLDLRLRDLPQLLREKGRKKERSE